MKGSVLFTLVLAAASSMLAAAARADRPGPAEETKLVEGKKATTVVVYWKDGLVFSTPDEAFVVKLRGNLHFDTKLYGRASANPTQLDVRRARIDLQGTLHGYIGFRLQSELADAPYIRNAWVDLALRDWLHLRGGQMKPPFSTSWWTLDNNVHFLERGAGTPVYPYFDRGWWLWGELLDRRLTWNLAGFTGAGMELDVPRGDVDDHKDWFGRLFASPFARADNRLLAGLHLCAEGSLGRQSIPTRRFELKGYGAAVRDDTFWRWETERNGRGEVGSRDRWGFELHGVWGRLSLSSEYLVTRYDDIRVFADDGSEVLRRDGDIRSWSTWVGWFLTGESKTVGNFGWRQPRPARPFDPVAGTGTGAWELLARYTRTRTDDLLFEPRRVAGETYRILAGAAEVDELTVGLSWAWNPMLRWQLGYTRLDGEGIGSGDAANRAGTKRLDHEDLFGLRLIFRL